MDPIDQAIAAQQQTVQLVQVGPVQIASTGRPFVLGVPQDLTSDELHEIVAWIANPGGLRAQLRPRPINRIVLPT